MVRTDADGSREPEFWRILREIPGTIAPPGRALRALRWHEIRGTGMYRLERPSLPPCAVTVRYSVDPTGLDWWSIDPHHCGVESWEHATDLDEWRFRGPYPGEEEALAWKPR